MRIISISIENYRGIKAKQTITLNKFTSIVGKNDSGKSIVLNAIASFLNIKEYPITISDFNNTDTAITIECKFMTDNISELLESKIKSKIKKADGLEEFLIDLIFDECTIIRKTMISPKKTFDSEQLLMKDYNSEDFAFLYGKSDEELNYILEKYSISIPVQGTGRNSKIEKIKYIKEYCTSQDIPIIEQYIDDAFKVCSLLPDVELFESDYGLEADTKFKSNSVSEIKDYFDRETEENKKLAIIEEEIEAEMQNEAQSVKLYMNEYVSSLNKVEIKPSISWKDAIKSVDVSFQFDGDTKPIPMSHKGSGYRRLFMVARFRYLAEKNKGHKVVYLIEEPETFLHPSAQEDLLNAFRELSDDNQVLISTHSPVFVGATNIESVVLCRKEIGSIYETSENKEKKAFIDGIVHELGIKPSFNLRDEHEKIVFVESSNDSHFYDLLCKNLLSGNLLKNNKILVLPFGGGEDIDSFLNIDYFDNSGRKLYLIIDSEKHTSNLEKQTQRADNFKSAKEMGQAYVLQKSCIENYYHPRAFERLYELEANSFDFIGESENAREKIKKYKFDNSITKNIKEKNNLMLFSSMTIKEWEDVIEDGLITFMAEILL